MRDPLLLPAVAVLAGVVAAGFVGFGTVELIAASAALFALCLLRARAAVKRSAAVAAFFFTGALLATVHEPGPPPSIDADPRETMILEGCVVEPPAFSDDREQFVLELDPGARARVTLSGDELPALRYGQRLEVDARVRPVRNFGNPGSFDYVRFLARRQVYWLASGRADTARVLEGECGSRFWKAIYGARSVVLERIERLYPGRRWETAMLQAVLIGHTAELERSWTEDFRRTGTYHALVVSGLHVTVLAAVLLFFLRLCAAPPWLSLALTCGASWFYALLCGWQPPVVRAAAGFMLFAAARLLYRRTRLLNLLSAVALVFVALDPEQIFDASFQLSFLSVAVLGALAVPLIDRTSQPYAYGLRRLSDTGIDLHLAPRIASLRVELRLLAETLQLTLRLPYRGWLFVIGLTLRGGLYLYELAAVSAVMQIGLALPMAVYFHRLSITGVTANVVIVPFSSVAVPVGFGAVLTGWRWLAECAAWLLGVAQAAAAWHVQWESSWRIPDPPLWLAALFAASLLAVALWRSWPAFCAVGVMLGVLIWHPFSPRVTPHALELTAIDVGQGESLFLALPDGKLMLVDTGGFPSYGRKRKPGMNIGEDVVSPYLWSRSVKRLDVVALTHGHEDHAGGLNALVANFKPTQIWNPGRFHGGETFDYGGAHFEVLSSGTSEPPENNDSLVLRVRHGRHAFLLTGDIERQVESQLTASGVPLRADVLKVAHHGSRSSTTPEMLEAVHPAVALISAGYANSFGNPHPQVLVRLREAGVPALRTDLWGYVSVRTDGQRLSLDAWRWRPRGRLTD
ncbi:MAG TPA: ComEC/Rec2 family competence protein [Bryobacteraceae bacterium]|nr:ComEC/Rec2 family competence protein [Bryobacteraceae bacterium]